MVTGQKTQEIKLEMVDGKIVMPMDVFSQLLTGAFGRPVVEAKKRERASKAVVDLFTGMYYRTESSAAWAVVNEYPEVKKDNFAWYPIQKFHEKNGTVRFRRATAEEVAKAEPIRLALNEKARAAILLKGQVPRRDEVNGVQLFKVEKKEHATPPVDSNKKN